MRLFLFLSALLASLAGIGPGARAASPVEAGLTLGASPLAGMVRAATPAAHRHLIPAVPTRCSARPASAAALAATAGLSRRAAHLGGCERRRE